MKEQTYAELEKEFNRPLTNDEREIGDKLYKIISNINKYASTLLPKGNDDQTEIEKMTRACIPDTYEWFEMKFSLIPKLDNAIEMLDCLEELVDYFNRKMDEILTRAKVMIE